jgi:transcriptional regulator
MYKTSYNVARNQTDVLEFMEKNTFIILVGFDGEFPVATQVPVETLFQDGTIKIIGHIMNKTDHHKAFQKNPNVLAIYTGPHAYISAAVYENPQSASTWNYKTVQAKGKIVLLGPERTYQIIKDITDKYEASESSPAAFHKMGDNYIRKNLRAITGFEITVSGFDHVYKMSQGHSEYNTKAIINELEGRGDEMATLVAKEMKTNHSVPGNNL